MIYCVELMREYQGDWFLFEHEHVPSEEQVLEYLAIKTNSPKDRLIEFCEIRLFLPTIDKFEDYLSIQGEVNKEQEK